jgi:hypothetical protein
MGSNGRRESVAAELERCRRADEERIRLGIQNEYLNRPRTLLDDEWLKRNRGKPGWEREWKKRVGRRR